MAVKSSSIKITRNVGRPTAAEDALALWAVGVGEELQRQQVEKDFVASGESLDNYEVVVTKKNHAQLEIAGYLTFSMEGTGRRPGTVPNIGDLMNWIEVKGIQPDEGQSINSLAWAIGIKQSQEGNQVFRGEREGIDIIQAIENSFTNNGDEMAMIIANSLGDKLVVDFNKAVNTKK